jgi:wyosine [tRNA(Phe)-imidazoG37] synthetase (radical SAM superfamily)
VDVTVKLRNSIYPRAGTAILTNGSTLIDEVVREAVTLLDRAIVKLDAALPPILLKVNRPYKGFDLETLRSILSEMDNLEIQTLFIDGRLTNAGENVDEWIKTMKLIGPQRVQIYSLDRIPAEDGIVPLSRAKLDEIAKRLKDETGIIADVY